MSSIVPNPEPTKIHGDFYQLLGKLDRFKELHYTVRQQQADLNTLKREIYALIERLAAAAIRSGKTDCYMLDRRGVDIRVYLVKVNPKAAKTMEKISITQLTALDQLLAGES